MMHRIDFHTHILPNVDDGAETMHMTARMLQVMEQSHVEAIVATPHYFSLDENPKDFLKRVQPVCAAFSQLVHTRVLLGAEVYLERGLLLKEDLADLCIQGTDLLLIELPVSKYRDWMYQTIVNIASIYGVRPVIAHVERILPYISSKELNRLMEIPGICFQFNHSAFSNRKALKLLKRLIQEGYLIFLGSDCHDMERRAPTRESGYQEIEAWFSKKISSDFPKHLSQTWLNELKLN